MQLPFTALLVRWNLLSSHWDVPVKGFLLLLRWLVPGMVWFCRMKACFPLLLSYRPERIYVMLSGALVNRFYSTRVGQCLTIDSFSFQGRVVATKSSLEKSLSHATS